PVVKASNKALLSGCNLSWRSCEALSSVLSSPSCSLRHLDLSNNNLQDFELKLFSAGLKNSHCALETLSLSGCLVTEEGCVALASALSSNPSSLRELDLSYNHPGDSGLKLLSAGLEDPNWKLENLRVEPRGQQWLIPGLKKYACTLTLETSSIKLQLSENNRRLTAVRDEQPYRDHPNSSHLYQMICRDCVTPRCYWEVEVKGSVHVAVAYKGITRREIHNCRIGRNDQSWSLKCCNDRYSVWHNDREMFLSLPSSSPSSSFSSSPSVSHRVAVYVDCPTGSLSFFRVSSNTLIHLHTFSTTFTEPLYPGFRLCSFESSVFLP
ncbi:ribonuclease inhibitor-like, partial [Plectropomus leopardus]|uniref:ribonuclease inhibitor-like n=1 Tax=Plectropomus leopardus TaxID=160734 RepID=UPI001C4BA8AA